jgi:hypothetical protein
MRLRPSQISPRVQPADRPGAARRPGGEKSASERKPRPKRSLNEAAHKLGR